MNPAETRFAAYLDAHGYSWAFEPDYQDAFGLSEQPRTEPDFLIWRTESRAVCEVRQFETTRLRDALNRAGGHSSSVDPRLVYGSLRSGIREKAEQLRPFAELRVPLIVVLANPLAADVMLDSRHVTAAMFGNPSVRFQVDSSTGGLAADTAMRVVLEDYGVFRSPVMDDGPHIVGWENTFPYVSAVAVVHERLNSMDWREEIIERIPVTDQTIEAASRAAFRALKEINEAVAAGEEPTGVYRWLELYECDGEQAVPLPSSWFGGPRDRRFGFLKSGAYGMLVTGQS
jgi:hypothetical protein